MKPKEQTEQLVKAKQLEELTEQLRTLQASMTDLQNEITDIEDELNAPNITKGIGNFDTVNTENENVNSLVTQSIEFATAHGVNINADDIDATNISATNAIDAPHGNITDLDATDIEADNIKVNVGIDTPDVSTDTFTATNATIKNADIANLNVTNASISTYQVNKVDASEVETPLVKSTEAVIDAAAIDDAEIQNEVVMESEIVNLKNRNRYFKDETQTISVEATSLRPAYIAIPTKGVQIARIVAVDDLGEQFSVIYNNARHTPLIQWSKRNDDALNKMFYSENTSNLYLQTYMSATIQWSIDGYEDLPHAPLTYSETFPEPISDCFRYNSTRKQGIVLMGDGEDGVVLSVQGTIEGNFLVDSGEFTYVNFYSDSAYDLFKVAKAFFRTGSDEDGWRYEKAQVFGYLRHTDTVAPAYEPYTFSTYVMTVIQELMALSGPMTSADTTFVDTDPLVNDVFCAYTTGGSTQLYTTVNGEYKKILKICTTTDSGTADVQWPIVWVEGDDVTSLASASIRLLEPRSVSIPDILSISYYTATGSSHSPYRDEDNTEIEALEKVEYVDENTILLTIDNKYGQDEIEISGSEIQEDEKLPFVLGFTFRTPHVDAVFNEDSEPFPGARGANDFNGQF